MSNKMEAIVDYEDLKNAQFGKQPNQVAMDIRQEEEPEPIVLNARRTEEDFETENVLRYD